MTDETKYRWNFAELSEANKREIKTLLDDGRMMEAAWQLYRDEALPADAPASVLELFRDTFFLGGRFCFTAVRDVLEAGDAVTQEDHRSVTLLDYELETFVALRLLRYASPAGSG